MGKTLNKADLVEALAKKTGMTKVAATAALEAVTSTVTASLKKGDKIQLTGFGTFEVRKRAARKAKNPQTGETIKVPATKVPAFRAGKGLKDAVK